MSDSANSLAARLAEAVALVQKGRRAEGRAILLVLSERYPDNELVWMWLATAADDTDERINSLRRVVAINPRNEKARSALLQLTGSGESLPPIRPEPAPIGTPPDGSGRSPVNTQFVETALIFGLIGAVLLIGAILLSNVVIPRLTPPTSTNTPPPTNTPIPTVPTITPTPTYTPGGPTVTPLNFLPPTWTPTDPPTPRPTRTLAPTLTPNPTATPASFFEVPPPPGEFF
jgi:hypothetical protein